MNLDDAKNFSQLDKSGMLDEIRNLADQLEQAWETAAKLPLPEKKDFKRIVLAGMGGSAIGADLLASYIYSMAKVPLHVLRGYELPGWASGPDDLIVCSSHSGNTEETLSVFEDALEKKCTIMAVATGGKLVERAGKEKVTAWTFVHPGQPRAAVGFSFGMLLNLFTRLGLVPDQEKELHATAAAMREIMGQIDADVPVAKNLAKRVAGQSIGRVPVIFGAEHLEPVARRWKTQINEIGKALAQFEFIPEADHNTLAGLVNPEEQLYKTYAVFLNSSNYHLRNQKRFDLTASEFMVSGACIDKIALENGSRLTEMWQMILLGDFISFYSSIAYDVDPTPVKALDNLKAALKK